MAIGLYPYGVRQSSWRNSKGDGARDFVESCQTYGITPGFYAELMQNAYCDVVRPGVVKNGDAEAQARYARIAEPMLTELWTHYGKLFELWFDGGIIPPQQRRPGCGTDHLEAPAPSHSFPRPTHLA
jgi:hypothetical protein